MKKRIRNGEGNHYHITHWAGQLGNHIIQLSNAIYLAERTFSKVSYPDHSLLRSATFDFSKSDSPNPRLIKGCFFYNDECLPYPLLYDYERRAILRKYIVPLIFPSFMPDPRVSEKTLVINIRSGDVFRGDYESKEAIFSGVSNYMQPPLSFYQLIIEKYGFTDILIVTQPDRKNPCIQGLMEWRSDIRIVEHQSPLDDLRILLSAKYLITAHSSFSWCAALMSSVLEVLFQPASFQVKGVRDIEIHTFKMNGYIPPGQWRPTRDNLSLMLTFPVQLISETIFPKLDVWTFSDLELSGMGFTRPPIPRFLAAKESTRKWFSSTYLRFRIWLRPRKRLYTLLGLLGPRKQ